MKRFIFLLSYLILTLHLFAQNQIRTTSVNLNFRKNPNVGENVICVIPQGTSLIIDYTFQKENEWISINYNGKFGYVYSKYLKNPEFTNNEIKTYSKNYSTSNVKYYLNSKGDRVQSPTYYTPPQQVRLLNAEMAHLVLAVVEEGLVRIMVELKDGYNSLLKT